MSLSFNEKGELVNLARSAIRDILDGKSPEHTNICEGSMSDALKDRRGVFVTIYRDHDVRGCIGYVLPMLPLWRATIENARNAAFRDRRFPPLRIEEYTDISIEISVLSEPVKLLDLSEFHVGIHGLILGKKAHYAVFLPRIPSIKGWGVLDALQHLSEKAGLTPDGWKDADSLEIFQVEVFSESEPVSS